MPTLQTGEPRDAPPSVAPGAGGPDQRPRTWVTEVVTRPGWPLAAILVPLPVWWALGLVEVVFLAMTVPMVVHLRRQRSAVVVPRGFGWWLLFLLWVVAGVVLLDVDAYGAVADESPTRILTFAYRLAQYLAITVVLVYVVNTVAAVTTTRIVRMVACLFLTITAGGLLGVLAPYLEFRSLTELALPSEVASNSFVQTLIHPTAAQLQGVLGFEAPRPSAPFAFTNTWGLNFALTLPFFLRAWLGRDAGWRRLAAGPVLLAAAVPAIYSINRGMWGALVAMALFVAVRAALTRRPGLLVAMLAGMTAVVLVVMVTPLGSIVALRFTSDGSEEGRANLGALTVESVSRTSPVVGLGSTRNVQGNFNSISGGSTAQCPRCSPPSLGTQGQLWLVTFSQGLLGLAMFAVFFALMWFRSLRVRSPVATMGLSVMVAWVVTLPVYNSLGIGMLVVMIAVGLLCRERAASAGGASVSAGDGGGTWRDLGDYLRAVRAGLPVVAVCALLGSAAGVGWSLLRPSPYVASASVLLPESSINDSSTYPETTLDTEAQLVASSEVRQAVAAATGQGTEAVVDDLRVIAVPNTRVLEVQFAASSAAQARAGVTAAMSTVVGQRATAIEQERASVLRVLGARESALVSGREALVRQIRSERSGPAGARDGQRTSLQRSLRNTVLGELSTVQSEIARVTADVVEDGRALGEVTTVRSTDQVKINVASGIALGGGGAAAMLVLLGPRLRRVRDVQEATGLPLLADGPVAPDEARTLSRALEARAADYLAVDDGDAAAVALADRMSERARSQPGESGSLLVAVATPHTRAPQVRKAVEHFRGRGLDVRGLILATPPDVDSGDERGMGAETGEHT